jgi:hypothetical protein
MNRGASPATGFAGGREQAILSSMSLSRTFANAAPASFYAFYFYAVTSPADRMRA